MCCTLANILLNIINRKIIHKGNTFSHGIFVNNSNLTCQDGQDTVPEGGDREGDTNPLARVAVPLRVLIHVPSRSESAYTRT